MPVWRVLVLQMSVLSVLGGCSVARENVRLTFDYRVLEPGAARAELEKQFGKPDEVSSEGGFKVARYSTARVDDYGKSALAASRIGIDLFTGGVGELLDPAALSENESKVLIVHYRDGRIVGDVQVTCVSRGVPRKYYRGFTCSQIMQG